MGLFDKLFGNSFDLEQEKGLINQTERKELADQDDIEKAISVREGNLNLADCLKISFSDIAALGTGFAQMLPALRTVVMTGTIDGIGYIPINKNFNGILKSARKTTPDIYVGAFKDSESGKSILANFIKASPQTVSVTTEMPVNPAMMMMAAMLVQIEKKLDNIQKTTDSILSFLELDKQAEQQGNINILNESLQNYKYNWDNQQYLQNHHMKALDIKQKAEQNIIFYQKQIAARIEKIPSIHMDSDVNNSLKELEKVFRDYRMAVYMFGFSAFMEVMLLGNFLEEYLEQVADKVDQYNLRYQKQFGQCRELLQKLSSGSIETQVVKALGGIGKFLGKAIGDSPLLSQGPVDEWLQENGQKLIEGQENKATRIAEMFNSQQEIGSEMFVDGIRNMDMISNHTSDFLFDKDMLYIACAEKKAG